MKKFKNYFISQKSYLIFVFILMSCGGGGGGGPDSDIPVSKIPTEMY